MQYGGFAEVYDRLMVPDFDYEAWANYIHRLLHKHSEPVKNVLDCACGTGLITARLAKLGYNMTGVDMSEEMLARASENARSAGVKIPFVKMDMCALHLHRPQDAIISTCDGVNYLQSLGELRGFLSSAHSSLKPGGLLLFDVSTRYKLEHVLGNNTFTEDTRDLAYIWRNTFERKTGLCEMELTLFIREGETYRRVQERHLQRGHTLDEIRAALEDAGFSSISFYDAFTEEPPHQKSERVQVSAVRQA